jgi:adenosine deaminase CECR1
MMKGLFNYETAYRRYTQLCLKEFVRENIQYAEIRVNFMNTNQVWLDDGSDRIDNEGIMNMIIDEYERFKAEDQYLDGLKIIYCTPRSFTREQIGGALNECMTFKKKYHKYIAGIYKVSIRWREVTKSCPRI